MTDEVIPKMLRLATVTPMPSEQDTNVTNIDGTVLKVFNAQIIRALSQGFGIPFQIIIAPDDTFGRKLPNGTWNGAIGMLVREEADLTVSGFTMNNERREVVNFTYPMYISEVSFLTDKSKLHPKPLATFDMFFFEVWIGIGMCLALMLYVLYMFMKKRQMCPTFLVDAMETSFRQALSFKVKYRHMLSLIKKCILTVFILNICYKTVILSVTPFPRMSSIRDITDLAKAARQGTIKCISYKGGYPAVPWFEANDDRLKSIEECRRRTEMEGIHGQPGFLSCGYKKAFISDRLDLITYERDYFMSDDTFIVSHFGIAYSKKFCCPKKLEHVVRRIVEADLYAKTFRDREYVAQMRMSPPKNDDSYRPRTLLIRLEDIALAVIVLSLGYMISVMLFTTEILGMHTGKVVSAVEKRNNYIANIVGNFENQVEKGYKNTTNIIETATENAEKDESNVASNVVTVENGAEKSGKCTTDIITTATESAKKDESNVANNVETVENDAEEAKDTVANIITTATESAKKDENNVSSNVETVENGAEKAENAVANSKASTENTAEKCNDDVAKCMEIVVNNYEKTEDNVAYNIEAVANDDEKGEDNHTNNLTPVEDNV